MSKNSISKQLSKRLRKIEPHLPTILKGVLRSIKETQNPLRHANAANGLRELLREVFESLSPDDDIKDCYWFVPDPSSKNGITRKHRILYGIHGYVGNALFPKHFTKQVNSLVKRIVQQTNGLQKLTHINKQSLGIPPTESDRLLSSTLRSYLRLLETIEKAKEVTLEELSMILSEELDQIFINDVFDKLDILSTHTRPQCAEDVTVTIEDIDKDVIYFSGYGSILCQLQYGSDGDVARGDGLEFSSNFPFTFSGSASTDLSEIDVDHHSIDVDTDSFYE